MLSTKYYLLLNVMELSIQEQVFDRLRKANKILIALPEAPTADSVASGLALKLFLQKLQKDVSLASSGGLPESLKFLPGSDSIVSGISGGKSFVITVDTAQKKLDEVSYQTLESQIRIYLKAKGEMFSEAELSFGADKFPVDVIVVLDALSLESLGELFFSHTDLFFETPKINIDHKSGNEYFGAVNLVDVTSSSVAEILSGLLQQFEAALMDQDIATCLLAGIITKTQSFKASRTTPQAFLKASQLVNLGGRQQEIIKQFYKTKSLPLLKLWGRVLARLKIVEPVFLAYSLLNEEDFKKSGATEAEIVPALMELLENVSGYKLLAILSEENFGKARLALAAHAEADVSGILQTFQAADKSLPAAPNFRIYNLELGEVSLARAETRFLEALKSGPTG